MIKSWLTVVMTFLLTVGLLVLPAPTRASPLAQDDPAVQCAEGVQLLVDGQAAEALPLLEAGFSGREGATFANPNDLGMCALALGLVRYNAGNLTGALEADAVALEIFDHSGNRWSEGTTLYSIGGVLHAQERYTEALEAYRQALAIWQEVGNQASQGTTLNNIGGVHHDQGHYADALEAYQQALAIAQEMGDQVSEGMILDN